MVDRMRPEDVTLGLPPGGTATIAASCDPRTGKVTPGARIERDMDGTTRCTLIGMDGKPLAEDGA